DALRGASKEFARARFEENYAAAGRAHEQNENFERCEADFYGFQTCYTNKSGREATKRELNKYKDPQRVILTAKVGAMVLFPEYYFTASSIYHSATGDPGEAAKDLAGVLIGRALGKIAQGPEAVSPATSSGARTPLQLPAPRQVSQYSEAYGQKGILGSLNEEGVLDLAIEAAPNITPRGKDMFAAAMKNLGPEVTAIRTSWGTYMPDNLNTFNRLLQEGKTFEEAARGTFTGTMAKRYGYSKVEVDLDKFECSFGKYTKASVIFRRP